MIGTFQAGPRPAEAAAAGTADLARGARGAEDPAGGYEITAARSAENTTGGYEITAAHRPEDPTGGYQITAAHRPENTTGGYEVTAAHGPEKPTGGYQITAARSAENTTGGYGGGTGVDPTDTDRTGTACEAETTIDATGTDRTISACPTTLGGAGHGDEDGRVSEARSGEPRWLDETEAVTWINLVRALMLLPAALDRQLRDEAGIPHAYYQILANLSERPDRAIRMTDLARRVGTTSSRLSHAVASLEQRGWVRREACPTDKRGQIARLTDAGMSALVAVAPGHVDEVRRLVFDRLTRDEAAQLGALAAKIAPAEDAPPAC